MAAQKGNLVKEKNGKRNNKKTDLDSNRFFYLFITILTAMM